MKLLIVAAFILLLSLVALLVKSSTSRVPGVWPFFAKRALSDAEQALYWKLVEALPDKVVLAQVQLSRFLGISRGNRRMEWLNRISQKSADFLICNKDFSVVAVIELDDATHNRASRQKADADKEKAIADAGLKVLRWTVSKMPTTGEILAAVHPSSPETLAADEAGGVGGAPPTVASIRPDRSGVRASRPGL